MPIISEPIFQDIINVASYVMRQLLMLVSDLISITGHQLFSLLKLLFKNTLLLPYIYELVAPRVATSVLHISFGITSKCYYVNVCLPMCPEVSLPL